MASFLVRAMNWQYSSTPTQTAAEEPSTPSDINLAIEDNNESLRLNWRRSGEDVDYYVIQWRLGDEEFNEDRQLTVNPADLTSSGATYGSKLSLATVRNVCMLRIIASNVAGSAASEEMFIPTRECELRRMIEQHIVLARGEDYPWLKEVWVHMNQPEFSVIISDDPQADDGLVRSSWRTASPLDYIVAHTMIIDSDITDPSYFFRAQKVYIHEMAHVYTLTNNIASQPAPLGVAHLYFSQLADETGWPWCEADELYADVVLLVTLPDTATTYWYNCISSDATSEEAMVVVRQALNGQMPGWLYETYQRDDDSLDLDAIWEEVKAIKDRYVRTTVIYQLRNEFGGYCSHSHAGSSVRNPWRAGGCT